MNWRPPVAEKKGLFGRLFGRKPKADAEEPAEEVVAEDAPAAVEEEPSSDVNAEDFAPRTEEEEMEDLDAAHSTIEKGEEPVVLVPESEPGPEPVAETPADDHDDISHAMAPEVADEDDLHAVEEEAEREAEAEIYNEELTEGEEPEPEDDPAPLRSEHDVPAALAPEIADEDQQVADTPAEPAPEKPKKRGGLFARLREGLAKTSAKLSGGIGDIFTKRKLDDETLEELEDLLITADLGLPAATRIITTLSKTKYDQEISDEEVRAILAEEVASTLKNLEAPLEVNPAHRPHVILMTGVNGAGKTTTIGKLARKFSDEGQSVLLAAGDTFRAAAIEQLTVWGERVGVPVVAKEQGADAAGLAFDAIKRAQEEDIDVVLIDTAGRLQNRKELMEELGKIVRVIKKLVPDAPHDTVLVLDATVGQNALSQAENFLQTAAVSGLIMTKLDGTARGGVLVALGDKFALPIHYIGVGEAVEDLQAFDAEEFAKALTARGE
ncbi:signal recognition particle-docking protein FtsY [Parvularcula marina]|uniref:Signal recognition particle receptor FtsY n=1 Tax=Parvularcula marina TaxID=2292771 RepID=A0A371RIT3_9PROT|nr:signal recognition particle-docking protein FtsY [Parvularcula marina]